MEFWTSQFPVRAFWILTIMFLPHLEHFQKLLNTKLGSISKPISCSEQDLVLFKFSILLLSLFFPPFLFSFFFCSFLFLGLLVLLLLFLFLGHQLLFDINWPPNFRSSWSQWGWYSRWSIYHTCCCRSSLLVALIQKSPILFVFGLVLGVLFHMLCLLVSFTLSDLRFM